MGIWQTNNDSFNVNIVQSLIGKLKKKGCKFCWVRDNREAMKEDTEEDTEDTEDTEDKDDQIFKVITSDGDTVSGYIYHMANGWCSGTSLSGWFIIHPGHK